MASPGSWPMTYPTWCALLRPRRTPATWPFAPIDQGWESGAAVLFRQLTGPEFESVSKALTTIELREAIQARVTGRGPVERRVRGDSLNAIDRDTLSRGVGVLNDAIPVLERLTTEEESPTGPGSGAA